MVLSMWPICGLLSRMEDRGRIQKCDAVSYTCTTLVLSGPAIEVDFGTSLNLPTTITFGTVSSTVYAFITDGMNQRVLRCSVTGTDCVHFAGTPGEAGSDTGHFFWPEDIAVGGGKVYVANDFNRVVQIFNANTTNNVNNIGVAASWRRLTKRWNRITAACIRLLVWQLPQMATWMSPNRWG